MTTSLDPVLTSPGWELLAAWEQRPERHDADPLTLGTALRRAGVDADTAAAILTQLVLRDHAVTKFGPVARHMVFTRDGLEQATRMVVAVRHAERFRAAGATRVADLGCGIGGDALALAGRGLDVLAIDRDPDAAACAAANLRDFPGSAVRLGDVTDLTDADLDDAGVDAIFADPARRTGAARGNQRLLSPDQWSPPLNWILGHRARTPRIGVKLAPGIDHAHLPSDCHTQWTSVDGDLVEAALWTPPLAPEGAGRSALVLRRRATPTTGDEAATGLAHDTGAESWEAHTLLDPEVTAADAPVRRAPVAPLGAVIAEPDPAVIRSGTLAHLAELTGAGLVSPDIAYLTGTSIPASPFLTRFEVIDAVALRPKAISAALRALDVGRVEVKKRGADLDPAALRKSLSLDGGEEATVIATRVDGRHRAIIARRLRD